MAYALAVPKEAQKHGIGDRLKQLRTEKGWSRERLGLAVGVSGDAIRQYELEVVRLWRNEELIKLIAQTFEVSPDYLLRGDLPDRKDSRIAVLRTGYRMVPVYGALTAGSPGYTASDVLDYVELADWGGEFERWGRIITGDSMSPEFEQGDVAIFEDRRAEGGHAVHAFCNGEDTFKVLRATRDGFELWPINTADYDPVPLQGDHSWTVKGVCIMRIREASRGVRDVREYRHGLIWKF